MIDNSRADWLSFFVVITFVIALCGCAGGRAVEPFRSATMPDPGGCYVIVYEQPQFGGAREFINGPVKYATLKNLPFRANWRRRIRSVQVGPTASVTIWEGEGSKGASQTLSSDSRHPELSEPLERPHSISRDPLHALIGHADRVRRRGVVLARTNGHASLGDAHLEFVHLAVQN